jgi:hypothetical protein
MNFRLLTLAAASAFCLNANATVTDWGVHDPLEIGVAVTPTGVFDDSYLFMLVGDFNVFSTAVSNNLTDVLGIVGGSVTLYREMGAVDTMIGSFGYSAFTGNISYDFGALAGGDYYYSVAGIGTGTAGGFYTISSTITPVPEPHTYALMLGGLGALGFVARRRRTV